MKLVVAVLIVAMTVVFLGSALVRYNHADAIRWIAMYGLAVAACIGFGTGRLGSWHAAAVAAVSLVWAATVLPLFWGNVAPEDMCASMETKTLAVEQAREDGGLLNVCLWMTVLAVSLHSGRADAPEVSGGAGT